MRYLLELSRVFKIAIRELRACQTNPVATVSKPAPSRHRVRLLTDDERSRLFAACKASGSQGPVSGRVARLDDRGEERRVARTAVERRRSGAALGQLSMHQER